MLELKNISYQEAGEMYIHPTDLVVQSGTFNNLLGATLSGKTTLMRLMAGLEAPSSGKILVDGEDVTGMSVRARDVAMVYQQFVNYPTMNVFDNIASPLCAAGKPPSDWKQRVGEVAEMMRISDLLMRKPNELSGGQQQRVAIARALVRESRLVLLDEPLANLDYKLREELREELPRLFAARGSVIVYATTEPGEALLMGGNTLALHQGKVVQFGATAEVYHHPKTLLAARIFSDPPLNEMIVVSRNKKIVAEESGISLPPCKALANLADGAYYVAFRPYHLKLGAPPAEIKSVSLVGEVIASEISGSESFMYVRVGDGAPGDGGRAGYQWVLQTHEVIAHLDKDRVAMHVAVDNLMVFAHGAGTETDNRERCLDG